MEILIYSLLIFILSSITCFNKSRFNLPFLPVVLIPLPFNIVSTSISSFLSNDSSFYYGATIIVVYFVILFIAGQSAPKGKRMGHAGAIVSGGDETAIAKMKIMDSCGIKVCESPAEIGTTMKNLINKGSE